MGTRPVLGILLLLSLAAGRTTAAEVPVLLADVNSTPPPPVSLISTPEPTGFFQLGNRLLFSTRSSYFYPVGDDGILWSTDGTAEGTRAISSTLCPGPCHGIRPLAVWRGLGILMTASGDSNASYPSTFRLWRTDGTTAGTVPLTGSHINSLEAVFSPAPGVFYFTGCRRSLDYGCVLWRSDGTRAGTSAVQDAHGTTFYDPHSLTFWRGRLYFVAADGRDGQNTGLWSTDGTPGGTALVTAVGEGSGWSILQATSSRLFFGSGETAEDLWATDGTPEGTRPLLDLNPEVCLVQTDRCEPVELQSMFTLGEKFYFITNREKHGNEIWSSDGTRRGTRPLVEMAKGFYLAPPLRFEGRWLLSLSTGPGHPASLWTAGDGFTRLKPLSGCAGGVCPQSLDFLHRTDSGAWLFAGRDAAHGDEVWITDGTAAGTRLLADICPGPCAGYRGRFDFTGNFGSAAGRIYFAAYSDPGTNTLYELWVTDGTPASTHRVTGHVSGLGFLGDLAVFGAGEYEDPIATIWSTDGTAAGTRRITDLRRIAPGSDPQIHSLRNGAVFLADEGDRQALWTSDGRPEGTSRFFEFITFDRRVLGGPWIQAGDLRFFQAESEIRGKRRIELWRTDGTAQGTSRVAMLPRLVDLDLRTSWNGKLLFQTRSSLEVCSFWSSDGTAAGTREILPPAPGRRCATAVLALGSRFVFVAGVQGPDGPVPQFFVSDGTPEGTRQISRIRSHREAFQDDGPVAVEGVAFFRIFKAESSAESGIGLEVWRTDGTSEGTYRAYRPSRLSGPANLYGFRGSLYLSATTGTGAGTFRVPVLGGEPVLLAQTGDDDDAAEIPLASFTPLGDRLLFTARDDAHGSELWVTDGTPAGTRLLRDIHPGPMPSWPGGFIQAGDRVFFAAEDGEHGRELWASDGTPEGTRLVWDLNPGGFPAFESGPLDLPTSLTAAGGYLFFSADDGETGMEPWSLLIP